MTNLNLGDLYDMLLHRLRKDKKGSVSVEEFGSFIRWRNLDYYNKMFKDESATKYNEDAIRPFLVSYEDLTLNLNGSTQYYEALLSGLAEDYGHWANVWVNDQANVPSGLYDLTDMTKVDIVSETELQDRLTNAITGPTADHPIGNFSKTKLYIHGVTATGYVIISYYKLPSDPYFDYYTDASGNITYLTDGQAAYTLLTGEVARDSTTAGGSVTSTSVDLDWDDDEAVNILDMVVSDVSIALSDPNSFQASLLERKEN